MKDFTFYKKSLEQELQIYYNSLQENDKIKKLKLVEDHFTLFCKDYWEGEKFTHDEYKTYLLINDEIYAAFKKSIGLDI